MPKASKDYKPNQVVWPDKYIKPDEDTEIKTAPAGVQKLYYVIENILYLMELNYTLREVIDAINRRFMLGSVQGVAAIWSPHDTQKQTVIQVLGDTSKGYTDLYNLLNRPAENIDKPEYELLIRNDGYVQFLWQTEYKVEQMYGDDPHITWAPPTEKRVIKVSRHNKI